MTKKPTLRAPSNKFYFSILNKDVLHPCRKGITKFLLLVMFAFSLQGYAQDDCSSAVPVTAGEIFGTTITPSTGGGEMGQGDDSAWFAFTAPGDGTINVNSCLGGSDTDLSIGTGTCGALTDISNNDDACDLGNGFDFYASEILGYPVLSGQVYYIEWSNYWEDGPFDWSLEFNAPQPAPDNDDCADATAIACGDSVIGSTVYATDTAGNGASDVFYSLAGTANGEEITASLCGSSFDTLISIFDACDGTELFSNDDSCGLQSEITFTSDGATTYIILVEGFFSTFSGTGASGDYTLAVTCEAPPECAAPTINSTTVVDNCNPDGTGTFTVEIDVTDAGDAGSVFDDGTNTYPVVAGIVTAGPYNSGDSVTIELTALDPDCSDTVGTFTFTCPLPAPENDDCADATAIACGDSVTGSTANATNSEGNAAPDVFYSIAGTANGEEVTVSLCGSLFDTVLTVFEACGGTVVATNDDSCGLQSELTFTSDGATTYIVRVEGFGSASGDYALAISCVPPPECTPAVINDATVVDSCNPDGTGTFTVEIDVTDAGDAGSVFADGTNTYPVVAGIVTAGPYNSGDSVTIELTALDADCSSTVGTFTFTCPEPAPENDDCAGALPLECGVTITGNTENATASGLDAECSGFTSSSAQDLFYTFDADGTSSYTLSLDDASGGFAFDGVIFVYSGPCVDLTSLGCSDSGSPEEVTLDAPAAGTYTVRIFDYSGTAAFVLDLTCLAAPECVPAVINDATVVDNCNPDGTGTFTVEIDVTDAGDAGSVFADGTNTYPVVAGIVTAGPYNSGDSVTIELTALDSDCSGTVGTFTFTCPLPAPENDDCADATAIACGDSVTGSTANATNSEGNAAPDVFYSIAGTANGEEVTVSLCGSLFDTVLTVFEACGGTVVATNDDSCGLQSELTFTSDGATTYIVRVEGFGSASGDYALAISCVPPPECTPAVINDATVVDSCNPDGTGTFTVEIDVTDAGDAGSVFADGTNTYPVVAGIVTAGPYNSGDSVTIELTALDADCSSTVGTFTFTCPEPAPENDDCAGALPLECGVTITGNTENATASGLDAECSGFTSSSAQDLFYTFDADGTSSYTLSLADASGGFAFDGVLFVYSGPCVDLTSIACSDSSSIEEIMLDAPAAGTYTVRIFDYSGTAEFVLDLTCIEAPEECTVAVQSTTANGEQYLQVCEEDTNSIQLEAIASGNGNLSYQWQILSPSFTWQNIDGATNSTLTIDNLTVGSYNYRVVVTSDNLTPNNTADDCTAVSGSAAFVGVNPSPTVTFTAPANLAIDAGVQTGLSGGSPQGGIYSGPGVTDDGNGTTYSFDPAAAGVGTATITYNFTNSNGCIGSASDEVEVTDAVVTAPENDDCAGALPLECGVTITGNTENATASGLDAECSGFTSSSAQDLFYTFDADGTSSYTLSLDDASGGFAFDGVIFVYSGPCVDLTSLGCSDSGSPEEVTLDAPAAGTYTVRIFDWSGTAEFVLDLTCVAAPECMEPTIDDITVVDSCNPDGTGTFSVDIVVSDAGSEGTVISDGTNTYPVVAGTVTAGPYNSGDTVTLTVDAADDECDSDLGEFTFTCPLPGPDNDACADAEAIACGDNITTNSDNGTDTDGNGSVDVWYSFTGTVAGEEVTLATCDSDFDTTIEVYSGTCDDATSVAFNDDSCGLQSEVTFTSDGISTYLIRVEGFSTATGNIDMNVTCAEPQPELENDNCVDAEAIACGDNITANSDNGTDTDGNGRVDVWYSFTGTIAGEEVTLATCDSDFDTTIEVYSGPCDDATVVVFNDDSCGFQSEVTFISDGVSTYLIRVEGFGTATGNINMDVTCEGVDPCADLESYVWIGNVNSDWTEAGNWDSGLAPGLSVTGNVFIFSSSNYPVLMDGQELYIDECSTVIVETGASLTVNPNAVVTNDGVFDNADGTVTFESDATGSAYIGSGNGMFVGDYTVERYIPAKRAYRQLGSPVTTSTPISENWQLDTHITGPIGNTDGFDGTETGNPSMYIFDNMVYEYVQMANTNATNLYPGTMYHTLIRGDRTTDLTNNEATPSVTTLRATGELTAENEGSKTISVNVPEQRFIAAGNPFQSQVDMNVVLTTNATNISPNFYWVWDPTLGARGAYTAIIASSGTASSADSDANQYLQAGQAGWVYTAGAGVSSVSFTQASKNTSGLETSTFSDSSDLTSQGKLRLSLYESSALANNETATDGLLILFDTNGNNVVDANDARNITNLDENFATNNNDVLLSIESRATPMDEEEIQLEINTYRNTNYTIVAEGISMQGATAYLYDNFTDSYTQIPQSGIVNYDYAIDSEIPGSIDASRFTIVFSVEALSVGTSVMEEILLYPNPTNIGKFYLDIPLGMDDLEVTIYSVLGAKLYNESGLTAGRRVTIDATSKLDLGTYFVELRSQGKTTVKKLIIN